MLAKEKEKRQNQLIEYIYTMSDNLFADDTETESMAIKLQALYADNFRHNYSDFFPVILEISKDDNSHNKDYLSNNLEALRCFVENDYVSKEKRFSNIYHRLEKLCDHINLEIGRLNYYSKNENMIGDLASKTENYKMDLKRATVQLNTASKKASSMQTEVIAVLSIFAGIVFTFSGGLTFLGSVMTSIEGAQHYEMVVLAAIICGMVIFNTIFLLMYLVGKITDRNIYARCKTEDCSCEKSCVGIKKVKNRLPYVFWLNAMCIVGIVIDCVVWYWDIVGFLGL